MAERQILGIALPTWGFSTFQESCLFAKFSNQTLIIFEKAIDVANIYEKNVS
jgi:hypothetical protein